LDTKKIAKGQDRRTTIMIRNIPNKYTQAMLLQEIDANFRGGYDFFYLPIDFKNRCNVGYAFINFIDFRRIVSFTREFHGQRWRNFNSEKVCAISYARIQGKASMISRFQNSSLMEKDGEYRPLLF
ncbi:RNA recognition motif 2-domain-containing protein, partial [Tribonema minus]